MSSDHLLWWNNLRHSGLLLDLQRLNELFAQDMPVVSENQHQKLRKELNRFFDDPDAKPGNFVSVVLEQICGLNNARGKWYRGSNVAPGWTRHNMIGEAIRPNHLWIDNSGGILPVFIDSARRLGIGHGKRPISRTLQWLRKTDHHLAVVTNGRQWRILYAGLDYEAWCEWDIEQWFAEGKPTPELLGFKGLLAPGLWEMPEAGQPCLLETKINEARKGQADLSVELGERVRQAAELLIQAHALELNRSQAHTQPQDIYRAAVRIIMRMVVVLFAESREELLPTDHPVYQSAYSIGGLREQLSRISGHRMENSYYAYPRLLALFRLIYQGSSHEAFPVPEYSGTLFAPGDPGSQDGMIQALYLFESACFDADLINDLHVRRILDLLTKTRVKLRQGRSGMWVTAPVDFSSLGNEYIGILYEGLLDFELRCAPENQPVVFLAVGNNPALPLATLEAMNDQAIKNLLEKLKDTSSSDAEDNDESESAGFQESEDTGEPDEEALDLQEYDEDIEAASTDDRRATLQARAEAWACRACQIAGLVKKPKGKMTPEKQMQHERAINETARKLVSRVILPGEWYLVRWGGTRKGAGTFYTRPQLAIPTVHRTLMPLAYEPPTDAADNCLIDAPADRWIPKKPEEILNLKICDPACGSGTFLLAGLRFLTDALYESLVLHDRVREYAQKSVLELICDGDSKPLLSHEDLPCRPDDDNFESQTKAVLRRYVVERCLYGVDIDPLAVELCRLSLWIETIDPKLPMTFLKHKIKCGNSLVGAWFDTFLHYPAMAWAREGGDKTHSNAVHYEKEQWTRQIRECFNLIKQEVKELIDGHQIFQSMELEDIENDHDAAEKALCEIHDIGIAQVRDRAEKYKSLQNDPQFKALKDAFDLWCALWFWPADQIESAPSPSKFYNKNISIEAWNIARKTAEQQKFFHWELEYPDVFNHDAKGFDAVLGNPPWDIAKPNSKEFFSAIDPLYRGYGKQEAIGKQKQYFTGDAATENQWLQYNAFFKSMANWTRFAGHPFGDRVTTDSNGRQKHDLPIGERGAKSFETSAQRHAQWKTKRLETKGYVDASHPFCHQGGGDINLYKLFLEQTHALLKEGGRLGFVVPSGIYSDHGTGALRTLFIEHCKWEWLFGFENRDKIFDIHRSFKFNPVIIEKGGCTKEIQTGFMHRKLADWEDAERHAIGYPGENVIKFSPRSRALLEIQSSRDLEILDKIYSNSVLLGDQGPEGWGIQYATEFHMTNDSKLFPPRPKWEQWGYQPDEYSRWIKGPWQPIDMLYAELGIDPPKEGETGCAQPPYDKLSLARADIPAGIILSRDATQFIREEDIPEVIFTEASGKPLTIKTGRGKNAEEYEITGPAIALPLYEGRMIGQFDFSEKGWVSGSGRSAVWRDIPWENKIIEPQYLMGSPVYDSTWIKKFIESQQNLISEAHLEKLKESLADYYSRRLWIYRRTKRSSFMDITSATNERTTISTITPSMPFGNSAPVISGIGEEFIITGVLNSFVFDYVIRSRCTGLHLNWFVINEACLPSLKSIRMPSLNTISKSLSGPSIVFSVGCAADSNGWKRNWALSQHERLRLRCIFEAALAKVFGLKKELFKYIFNKCDLGIEQLSSEKHRKHLSPKGFWRIDKDKHPEQRLTVLSLIAFHDLEQKIADCGGDRQKGIEAFMNQNNGEGWMLPETLRLADYGLGHDERAKQHQPVRECFGPRFFDWQLAQDPEESWRECHLHARNLLGPEGYQALLDQIEGKDPEKTTSDVPSGTPRAKKVKKKHVQLTLFDTDGKSQES